MTPKEALDLVEAYMLRGERPRVDLGEVVRVLREIVSREVFLDCPACEQPCHAMPGEPNPQWHDGDAGDCACGARVIVYADDQGASLALADAHGDTAPPRAEPLAKTEGA